VYVGNDSVGLLGDIQVGSSTTSSTVCQPHGALKVSGVNYGVTVMASGTMDPAILHGRLILLRTSACTSTKTGNVGIGRQVRVPKLDMRLLAEARSHNWCTSAAGGGLVLNGEADIYQRSMRRRRCITVGNNRATRTDKPWRDELGELPFGGTYPHRRTTAGVIKATSPNGHAWLRLGTMTFQTMFLELWLIA